MRTVLSWSGGKDAAYALAEMRRADSVTVKGLLTTVAADTGRSSMHGVRRELYERQAAALDLPIEFVELPTEPTNEAYERVMAAAIESYATRGIDRIAFADLLLDDVRAYREARLSDTDLDGYWPLWGRDTTTLAADFVERFAATVVSVDGDLFDRSFAGRAFDAEFLADLPEVVDPCGENGEFHTFVWDGPIFEDGMQVRTGETVTRAVGDGEFHYCELVTG
ncbi:Dph6-related ATP pyrophosphatase [Halococcus sediminicola]|uniref:Dph6-related ATP pyrophosphatase n=1 Tax=Halococcus sediminicola TaxID=1264579 RepID=UPI0006794403|nr:ATP-binding protein [Halococcus sediminicola]